MKTNLNHLFMCGLCVFLTVTGCGKYLDVKPQSKMTTPKSLEDCQGLLDDYQRMNTGYPSDGEASADNYYLTESGWGALRELADRERYVWASNGMTSLAQWLNPYRVVYNANLVLQTLEQIGVSGENYDDYSQVKGAALFFRAFAFFNLAEVYAPPYIPLTANSGTAIPLRLSAGIDIRSRRNSVAETYQRIIADLKESASLLPVEVTIQSRPSKSAAFALLARAYLSMSMYGDAWDAASASLGLKGDLLDYNLVGAGSQMPFPRFNNEVVFHAVSLPGGQFGPSLARVDTNLMAMYRKGDLRRDLFYIENPDGTHGFRGSYDGTRNGTLFVGLTTSEMTLIKAEAAIRTGRIDEGIEEINRLMRARYSPDGYRAISKADGVNLLRLVLDERRKELVFRGLRWSDLRRLNRDPDFAVTIARKLGNDAYELAPADERYVLLIPEEVLENSDMPQNIRTN